MCRIHVKEYCAVIKNDGLGHGNGKQGVAPGGGKWGPDSAPTPGWWETTGQLSLGIMDRGETKVALEEESLALPVSSASEAEFDAVIGFIEDIIMDTKFQVLQRNFMDRYYLEFEDTEENKLTYTPIFNEYLSLVEKYIEEQLLRRIPGFNMAAFTATLRHRQAEVADDIFDMLLTFADFLAFKEMFLNYRAEKEGRGLDLSSGLVVTSLYKSSFMPNSRKNLEH